MITTKVICLTRARWLAALDALFANQHTRFKKPPLAQETSTVLIFDQLKKITPVIVSSSLSSSCKQGSTLRAEYGEMVVGDKKIQEENKK